MGTNMAARQYKRAQTGNRSAVLQPVKIAMLTIVGMIGLAFVAILVPSGSEIILDPSMYFVIGRIAVFFGFMVGCAAVPFTVLSLFQKNLLHAMSIVYGVACVAVVIHVSVDQYHLGVRSAVTAFVTVAITSIMCRFLLKDDPRLNLSGHCPKCGFDLRGSPSGGCPECGWQRVDHSPQTSRHPEN
jgi:peptidoglycan/LPS O-acetylase OafA/YrhL